MAVTPRREGKVEMPKEVKLLVSAVAVALFSLTMFAAAAFFYNNLHQLYHACSEHGLIGRACYGSESVAVSVTSMKAGIAWFSAIGLAAWMAAVYVSLKCKEAFALNHLP